MACKSGKNSCKGRKILITKKKDEIVSLISIAYVKNGLEDKSNGNKEI